MIIFYSVLFIVYSDYCTRNDDSDLMSLRVGAWLKRDSDNAKFMCSNWMYELMPEEPGNHDTALSDRQKQVFRNRAQIMFKNMFTNSC